MNAIISLCHFCENHGPSILFCTQAFHSQTALRPEMRSELSTDSTVTQLACEGETSPSCDYLSRHDMNYKTDTSPGHSVSGPPVCDNHTENGTAGTVPKTDIKCDACRSLPTSLPGFISNDSEAMMSYMSSQHPSHPQVFSMVRQACVRSLSTEVSPGKEGPGPIFFGDDNGGYVLSHVFILKDSQYSRGFQRRYSIIIVMMDKIFLLNSWPFLVKHVKGIIEEIQAKALKVYEQEQAKCPARPPGPNKALQVSHFSKIRGKIAAEKAARSLVELTGDKNIFRKLHQTFTWLLKAGGIRLTEKLLEGPPTEDSIIDVENQEETEEGFVLIGSKKDSPAEKTEEGPVSESDDDDSFCPTFRHIRHLFMILGHAYFLPVAHHVVIGNQIVVRGSERKLVKSVIDCLKVLLPKGCCRVMYYSNKYEESYKYNFVGVTESVTVPDHVDLYVLIDVHPPADPSAESSSKVDSSFYHREFSGYGFSVHSPTSLPVKAPTVLTKMVSALLNDSLAESVVDQCLICLKEEWMNKVKVLFKFTKAGGNRTDADTHDLIRIVGFDEDKGLLKFWKTGLSAQYKNHMLQSAINQSV